MGNPERRQLIGGERMARPVEPAQDLSNEEKLTLSKRKFDERLAQQLGSGMTPEEQKALQRPVLVLTNAEVKDGKGKGDGTRPNPEVIWVPDERYAAEAKKVVEYLYEREPAFTTPNYDLWIDDVRSGKKSSEIFLQEEQRLRAAYGDFCAAVADAMLPTEGKASGLPSFEDLASLDNKKKFFGVPITGENTADQFTEKAKEVSALIKYAPLQEPVGLRFESLANGIADFARAQEMVAEKLDAPRNAAK